MDCGEGALDYYWCANGHSQTSATRSSLPSFAPPNRPTPRTPSVPSRRRYTEHCNPASHARPSSTPAHSTTSVRPLFPLSSSLISHKSQQRWHLIPPLRSQPALLHIPRRPKVLSPLVRSQRLPSRDRHHAGEVGAQDGKFAVDQGCVARLSF